MKDYIGFDIGGTKCAVIAAKADWENNRCKMIDREQIATESIPWQETLTHLADTAVRLIRENDIHPVSAGISCGGPLDSKTGIILSPPNLPGWDNVPVTEYLESRLGIPAYLQNDANACTIAEWKFGAGKNCNNLIFLTFGTGLGAGLILDGKLYEGTDGLSGEVGHIRLAETGPDGYGKAGSFEGFCSGGGIARLGKMMVEQAVKNGEKSVLYDFAVSGLTAKNIAEAAEKGDALAKRIYTVSAEKLGLGLSMLIDILNPQKIIIGSVFARSEHLFRNSMEQVIKKEALGISAKSCTIVPAMLADKIGDYAAIAAAWKGTI
jgi:glucokinase